MPVSIYRDLCMYIHITLIELQPDGLAIDVKLRDYQSETLGVCVCVCVRNTCYAEVLVLVCVYLGPGVDIQLYGN